MISHLTEDFRECFRKLPNEIKRVARKNYQIWKQDPSHPSLGFKRVHTKQPIYSIRVGIGWRALGIRKDDAILWFWIGPHSVYSKLIDRL